jgi:hypothetical protein
MACATWPGVLGSALTKLATMDFLSRHVARRMPPQTSVTMGSSHDVPPYWTPHLETAQCLQAVLRVPSDGQDLDGLSIPIVQRSTTMHPGLLVWGLTNNRTLWVHGAAVNRLCHRRRTIGIMALVVVALNRCMRDGYSAYLVRSMGSRKAFAEEDRRGVHNFGEAAREAGAQGLLYLGGLGDRRGGLSPHLQSRQAAGEILRASGVQTIEFRASIVIGSGSLSFEMIRALVERLPLMITPRWVSIQAQPIAVTDLVQYLLAALDLAVEGHPLLEIGGADRMSCREIMREYARQRGLRRLMIPVPVLTPLRPIVLTLSLRRPCWPGSSPTRRFSALMASRLSSCAPHRA